MDLKIYLANALAGDVNINISSLELQIAYDQALLIARKNFNTSSGTKALCLSLGLQLTKLEIQKIRVFLFEKGVQLKVGDRQCVDPSTKQKKSLNQKKIRSLPSDFERVNKMKISRWGKNKETLQAIQVKQKNSLKQTLQLKMSDPDAWSAFQNQCQEKSLIAKASMTLEEQENSILKWKKSYWSKSDKDRLEIQRKKIQKNRMGFWLDGIWFGSSFELNMFQFLIQHEVNFIFQGLTCKLNGYTWHPDFFLPKYNVILEVKGSYPRSENYWFNVTLPKIREAKLYEYYGILVYWERKITASSLEELFTKCDRIV